MSASRLDAVYRSILITKFFTKGWGKPENLRRLFEFRKVVSNRDECFKLVERDYPVTITKEENFSDCRIIDGYFVSPLARHLPGIVPEVVEKAHFQAILPLHWRDPNCKPMCLHFAGTGDHFFWRRRNLMVKPLLKEAGIGGIILENPFYGARKPTDQVRSSLHNVSDIFVMGGCLILEALVLFHWCERLGLGPLGVTGLSMGGHMASLAATNWPKPLVLVPCLSWSTASAVFLQGVMSQSINWDLLEDQYLSDGMYREKLRKMVTIVDEAFLAGKKFARNYAVNFDPQRDKLTDKPTDKHTDKCKVVDVTYKESNGGKDHGKTASIELPINVTSDSKNHASEVNNQTSESYTDSLTEQLKKLVNEGKLNEDLYAKLTSNQAFQLSSSDVDEINQMSEEEIKELLFKCKLADLIKPQIPAKAHISPNSLLTQIPEPNEARDVSKTNVDAENKINVDAENNTNVDAENKINVDAEDKINVDAENKIESPKKVWTVSDFTTDWFTNLPWIRKERKIDISKIHWRDREALQFMRGVMDECTHLSNFSVPFDTSLIIAVCALHDAYVPRDDVGTLEEIWPGAEVRYVDAGHVSAYILHQSVFRSCIKEAFERSKQKWEDGKHID